MSSKQKQPAAATAAAAAAPKAKHKSVEPAAKAVKPKAAAVSAAATPAAVPGYRNEYRGFVPTPAGAPIAVEDCAGAAGKPALTADRFYTDYILARRPVVLRHFASSPASAEFASLMQSWPQPATLRHLAGQAPVRIEWAERAPSAAGFGRGQHEWMQFAQFLSLLGCDDAPVRSKLSKAERVAHDALLARHANHALYLTSQPIPEDAADGTPDALCAEPVSSLLAHMPLRPKLFEKLAPIQYNLWMGGFRESAPTSAAAASETPAPRGSPFYRSAGTSSGLHHDYHDNAYILLRGAKTFHLFPPSQAPNLYAHGMKAAEDPSVDADDKPQCIIHPNGVIEYVSSDAASTAGENDASSKAQMMQRELEEEAMEDEDEADDAEKEEEADEEDNEPTAEEAEDAAALAAYTSKHAAISAQIAELKTTLQTVRRNFDLTPESDLKRRKNLGIELVNVEKKLPALSLRLKKTEADEIARLKAVADRIAAAKLAAENGEASGDDDDDAEESDDDFPADLDLENLRDDYQDSDDNGEEEAEEEEEDDDDAMPAKASAKLPKKQTKGTSKALAALMAQMAEEEEDDDDDEDASIDPAERAAWEAFMAKTASASKSKKNAAPAAAASKSKRKKPASSSSSAAAATSSSSGSGSSKKQKTTAAASPSSSSSTAAAATSSAAESFPPNFSRLDFARLSASELSRSFPRFRAANDAVPSVVQVTAGDLLYLPASWWHEVFSRSAPEDNRDDETEGEKMPSEVHMALNYWFHPPSSLNASPSTPYTGADLDWERRFTMHYQPAALEAKRKSTAKLAQQKQQPASKAAASSGAAPGVSAKTQQQRPPQSKSNPSVAVAAASPHAPQAKAKAAARPRN